MANVLIEESTLSAIGEAIRAKTGKTDLILPSDMANEIAGITGGGGSELVKYVTFMNGHEELFRMPVLLGDDCKNPVSHGDIDTPTKESTNTTNYTYSGWSLTSGGSADSSALKNVTEDRIVYASYSESVRYYTVNFYTEVGVLYETVQVTYGGVATPSANPTKSGHSFAGWSPSNENIIADTNCYAVWNEAITFAGGSWEDILEVCDNGQASSMFAVGDTKIIEYGDTNIELMIAGFDHDDLADGSGKARMTIISNTIPNETTKHGDYTYDKSTARTYLNNTVLAKLPSDLQTIIKEVIKPYDADMSSSSHTIETVTDKLFLLSLKEMGGSQPASTGSYSILGDTYQAFSSGKAVMSAYVYGTEATNNYWLRQRFREGSGNAVCQYSTSTNSIVIKRRTGSALSSSTASVRFGFCI